MHELTWFPLVWWLECSPMPRKTRVQCQVESHQRLKKWYLIPPRLTLSIIRQGSRVKWSNPGKGVVPSPTPRCSSYWKGSLRVTLNYGRQLYFFLFLFNNNNHLFITQLYGFKYSYVTLIICMNSHDFKLLFLFNNNHLFITQLYGFKYSY